jgi:hypothetical protein
VFLKKNLRKENALIDKKITGNINISKIYSCIQYCVELRWPAGF